MWKPNKTIGIVLLALLVVLLPVQAAGLDTNTAGIIPEYHAHYLVNDSNISNAIDDYSTSTQGTHFTYQPPNGTIMRVSRLLITIGDASITNADEYGGINALTNGLEFWVRERGVDRRIDGGRHDSTEDNDIKTNGEFHRIAYDVNLDSASLGSGTDYVAVRWEIAETGTKIRLNGTSGDQMYVLLNDTFVGLSDQHFQVQGYHETNVSTGMGSPQEDNGMSLIAIAILVSIVMFVLYKASVELHEQHWPLRMGLFLGSLFLGWGVVGLALKMAVDTGKFADSVQAIYFGYLFLPVFVLGYFLVRLIWWLTAKAFNRKDYDGKDEMTEDSQF